MENAPALPAGLARPAACAPYRHGDFLPLVAGALFAALLLLAGAIAVDPPYTAGSALGYNLGLFGGLLMLLLLPYALRKRLRWLNRCGSMRAWFLFHIFAGLFGPLLVLFHTTFRIGSFNGGVALASTLLVAASGTIGRYFYRRVYRGLTGCRATLDELQTAVETQLATLEPSLSQMAAARAEIERYIAAASPPPGPRWQRAAHFLTLGWRRRVALRNVRRLLPTVDRSKTLAPPSSAERSGGLANDPAALLAAISATLAAAERAATFSIYERLFAQWHVVHIPFLYLLVLTSVVHVVAVHAY